MGQRFSGEVPWRRVRKIVAVTVPAAGADWLATVPAGEVWDIRSVYAQLVTSATVATRVPVLALGDGAVTFAKVPPAVSQAASLTDLYLWLPGVGQNTGGGIFQTSLPDYPLGAGGTVGPITSQLQAGDQWSAIYLAVIATTVRDGPADISEPADVLVSLVAGAE